MPFDSRTLRTLAALAMANFAMGATSLSIIGLLRPMAASLDVSVVAVAQLVTVFAITFAIAAPALQLLVGHWARRRLLITGLLLLAAANVLAACTSSYAVMVLARMVMAVGAAMVGPMAVATAASLVPPQQQGRALGLAYAGMTVATVLGIPLAAWLGAHWSWRVASLVFGGAALLSAGAITVLLADRQGNPPVTLQLFRTVLGDPAAFTALGTTLGQMAAHFASVAMVSELLHERFHVTPEQLPVTLMIYSLGGMVGNLVATRLSDSLGETRTLHLALGGMFVAFITLLLVPARLDVARGVLFAWSMFAILFQTPQQKRLMTLAPASRNVLLACNASALYLGISFGSFIGSEAYRIIGATWLPSVSAALVLVTFTLFRLSLRFHDKKTAAAVAGAA